MSPSAVYLPAVHCAKIFLSAEEVKLISSTVSLLCVRMNKQM